MKVVINSCYGGFSLSSQAYNLLNIAIVLAESKTEVREKVSVSPLFKANIKEIEPIKEGFYITES